MSKLRDWYVDSRKAVVTAVGLGLAAFGHELVPVLQSVAAELLTIVLGVAATWFARNGKPSA